MDKIDYGYKVKLSKVCDNIETLSPEGKRIAIEVMGVLATVQKNLGSLQEKVKFEEICSIINFNNRIKMRCSISSVQMIKGGET